MSVDVASSQFEQNLDGQPDRVRRFQWVDISQATVEGFTREKLREAL
ncbi:hypothetical protein [Candidatus Pelagisphaera phototrophica]|nr:hypothetical protein [Candidatus Pelagisphaera phototrophica]QXD32329.1 hypothetical protein GA004_00960 [Candidatus Pelagisphaera phototrophica]